MRIDAELKRAVRLQLSAADIREIESLADYCMETTMAPIFFNHFSDGFDQVFLNLERSFETISSEHWPRHFLYSPYRLMLIEFLHDRMRANHVKHFLDVGLYRSSVQSKSHDLAAIVTKIGDDAGLVRLQDAWAICAKQSIRLEVDQAIPGSTNSCGELKDVLWRFREKSNVYIRPNAFRLVDIESSIEIMEKAAYFGRPINKLWLKTLKGEEAAEHGPGEHSFGGRDCRVQYLFTRLDSQKGKEEIEFSCEELPEAEDKEVQCTRFIHGIYRPDLEKFEHFDGAIHFYEPHEYAERCGKHLKQRHKQYAKAKIFRIDELLDFVEAGLLIATFFRWNSVAPEYFTPLMSQS